MDSQPLTTLLLGLAILYPGRCLETPTLKLTDTVGNIIHSPANISIFQTVHLTCRITQRRSKEIVYEILLLTRAQESRGGWKKEARCLYRSTDESPSAIAVRGRTLNMDAEDVICKSDKISAIFPFRMRRSNNKFYACQVYKGIENALSDTFVIHTYKSSSDTPTMKIKDGKGNYQLSSTSILNSEKVELLCEFPQLYLTKNSHIYIVVLRTRTSESAWNEEAHCFYFHGNKSAYLYDNRTLSLTASDITCGDDGKFSMFTFNAQLSNRNQYDCLVRDPLWPNNNDNSSPVTIDVYTKPTTPVIQPDPLEGVEGQSMTVSCTSEAFPPPQLSIKVNDVVYGQSSPRYPPMPSVVNGTAEWRLQSLNNSFHNKPVVCEVYNHSYDGVLQTTKTFLVIYGPDNFQVAKTVRYYVNSGKPLILNGRMAGFPPLVYSWSIGNKKIAAENATVTLDSSDYSEYAPYPATFIVNVKGTNPRTGDTADNTITVFLKVSATAFATSGAQKPSSNGEIFAVVLSGAILIFTTTSIAA